ncbi:hypothetical protein GGD45_003256 [Rhizobium tropici]|uniref:Uncharacterized protein n=1 Tax=Rhizobium tropici TaxID=398 RepID=A0ABR6R108_RHITR|nr:hypothetical protein [Rhizobium tropici]
MPNACGQRRLPVALAFLDIGASKASQDCAVRFDTLPSENRANLELLRDVRVKRPPFELPPVQAQHCREKAQHPIGSFRVPMDAAAWTVQSIVFVPAAGIANVRPSYYITVDDLLGVFINGAGGILWIEVRRNCG